jgi:hypothetical protein
VLHERAFREEDRITTYAMLECAGCHRVCLSVQVLFIPDGEVEHRYYPSPVSRKQPDWLLPLIIGLAGKENDSDLGSLLHEVYQAVYGRQYRLAAMGIRALLEQVMVSTVGDRGSFEKQLDAFEEAGHISFIQRDAIKATLEVGHAAMHRAYQPTEEDLKVALDIVEGVMAPLYHHRKEAEKIALEAVKSRSRSVAGDGTLRLPMRPLWTHCRRAVPLLPWSRLFRG